MILSKMWAARKCYRPIEVYWDWKNPETFLHVRLGKYSVYSVAWWLGTWENWISCKINRIKKQVYFEYFLGYFRAILEYYVCFFYSRDKWWLLLKWRLAEWRSENWKELSSSLSFCNNNHFIFCTEFGFGPWVLYILFNSILCPHKARR